MSRFKKIDARAPRDPLPGRRGHTDMATNRLRNALEHLRHALAPTGEGGPTDGQLLARFAATRDEAAFEALLRRHGPLVLGVCRRVLRHAHDAEDAFQATFLVLARKAASIAKRDSVGSWLYGVAFRIACKARAAAARRRARQQPLCDLPAAEPAPALVWQDLRLVLDEEVNRLPEPYREPFVLCCLEGKTLTEAARQLGWPLGTVATRLARARARLRGRLVGRGLALSAGLLTTLLCRKAAAALPPALVQPTAQAACGFAAGKAVFSAQAAVLAEGVLQAMFVTKLKVIAVVLLIV